MNANRKKFELNAMESHECGPCARSSWVSATIEKPSRYSARRHDLPLVGHYRGRLQGITEKSTELPKSAVPSDDGSRPISIRYFVRMQIAQSPPINRPHVSNAVNRSMLPA